MGGIKNGDNLAVEQIEDAKVAPPKRNFRLKYGIEDACVIEIKGHDRHHLYVTGGSGGFTDPELRRIQMTRVSWYIDYPNPTYVDQEVPQLNIGRMNHACASFIDSRNLPVAMVTGGWRNNGAAFEDNYVQETEVACCSDCKKWSIIHSAPFPGFIRDARGINWENDIYITGTYVCVSEYFRKEGYQ